MEKSLIFLGAMIKLGCLVIFLSSAIFTMKTCYTLDLKSDSQYGVYVLLNFFDV